MTAKQGLKTMGDRIGVGVASYGMSGRVFHLPLLRHQELCRVRGVVERIGNELRKHHQGLRLFRRFDTMQIDDEIDPVVVNTPDATQSELPKRVLQPGKHSVVEKPYVQRVEQ